MLLKAEFQPSSVAPRRSSAWSAPRASIILGKETQVRLALACLLARGHLLIEDLPGVGKTTLAHVLASSLGLHFQRIQFTSDMLPADILGVSIYERDSGSFKFHPGPDLRAGDPRRRGQPRDAEDAVGAARGDGGAPGHRRGRDAQAARAVLRHRHAEPLRAGRHLPAARVAARPLPDAHRARLPGPRRRARAALRHRSPRHAGDARCRACRPPS